MAERPGAGERTRSASTWIGCGCASLVALFMFAVVLFSWLTYRAGKQLDEMTGDPERAAAEIRRVLPYDELPPGYRPVGTLEVPWVMTVTFIGGPGAAGEADAFEHGFFLVRIRDWFGRGERSADWLSGADVEMQPIEQQEFAFEPEELVARGETTASGAAVTWLARRGEVRVADVAPPAAGEEEGGVEAAEPRRVVLTVLGVDCDDGWQRVALWFVPDPAPGTPAEAVDWSGTPADPAALDAFLAGFALCG